MSNPRNANIKRTNKRFKPHVKPGPLAYKPIQPFVVIVPIGTGPTGNTKWRPMQVSATNGSMAIETAKQQLVAEHVIASSVDIRFKAKAVKVTAKVGDVANQALHRALQEAKDLVAPTPTPTSMLPSPEPETDEQIAVIDAKSNAIIAQVQAEIMASILSDEPGTLTHPLMQPVDDDPMFAEHIIDLELVSAAD